MAIDIETKDCTALSDAELAEMADICTDGPAGFDIGLLSKQREEWVLITQGRDGGKLVGLLLLHPGAHRRDALPAVGTGVDQALRQARRRLQGGHRRPVPPGGAGLPRRGRADRHPVHRPRAPSRRSRASRTSAPVRATRRRARSGPGAGAWPSASAPRAASTTAASWSQGDGSPVGVFDFAGAEARSHRSPTWPPFSSPWITTATTSSSPSGGAWPRIWRPRYAP